MCALCQTTVWYLTSALYTVWTSAAAASAQAQRTSSRSFERAISMGSDCGLVFVCSSPCSCSHGWKAAKLLKWCAMHRMSKPVPAWQMGISARLQCIHFSRSYKPLVWRLSTSQLHSRWLCVVPKTVL